MNHPYLGTTPKPTAYECCDCEIYEICPRCAPSQEAYDRAVTHRNNVLASVKPEPPLYTLSDVETFASKYADGLETTDCSKLSVQLTLLKFTEWLKEHER